MIEIQVGSTITNGSDAIRVTERVEADSRWVGGWRGLSIPLEKFGGNPGTTTFVADYLLASWKHVPFEWAPVVGGAVEERYVWSIGGRRLQREVRRAPGPPERMGGQRAVFVIVDEPYRMPTVENQGTATVINLRSDRELAVVAAILEEDES